MSGGKMFSLNAVASGVSGGGSVSAYANFAALPATAPDGSVAITTDTYTIYSFDLATTTWQPEASPGTVFSIGTFDSGTPGAKGATLGAAGANTIIFQSASNTLPGMVNIAAQTFKGAKTFTDGMIGALTGNVTGNVSGNAGTVTTNANLTGPVTSVGNATAIANGAISNAMLANAAVANLSGTNTGDQTNISGNAATVTTNANLTGPVTSVGNATAITALAITNAMIAAATIDLTAKVTGILPIANGGTNKSSVTIAPAATSWAGWDANKNLVMNNALEGYTTTVTAAGTTTLVIGSTYVQNFTGSSTQTVVLPVVSTLALGHSFFIKNLGSSFITVQSSGGQAVQVIQAGCWAIVECILITGTTAASWDSSYMCPPLAVVADTAISGTWIPAPSKRQVCKVHGSGGAVVLTDISLTNAQAGDELIVHGMDNTNTVQIGGTTNVTTNGSAILAQDCIIAFYYDGVSKWQELYRNF